MNFSIFSILLICAFVLPGNFSFECKRVHVHQFSIIPVKSESQRHDTKLRLSPTGSKEGVYLFTLSILIVTKLTFSPISFRSTYICPYGYGAQETLEQLQSIEPSYKCMTAGEYVKEFITAPIVLPGDPRFDAELVKTKMIMIPRTGTKS